MIRHDTSTPESYSLCSIKPHSSNRHILHICFFKIGRMKQSPSIQNMAISIFICYLSLKSRATVQTFTVTNNHGYNTANSAEVLDNCMQVLSFSVIVAISKWTFTFTTWRAQKISINESSRRIFSNTQHIDVPTKKFSEPFSAVMH